MKNYLLVAAGRDRPGIVAKVTGVLFRHHCNLADSSMTRLASEFSMLVVFQAPDRFRPEKALREGGGLFLEIKPLKASEARPTKARGRPHIISVHGADRPGIVHRVSLLLARRRVNITDVWTHRTRAGRSPGYVLFLEIELSRGQNPRRLTRELERLARSLRLRVSLRPVESSRI